MAKARPANDTILCDEYNASSDAHLRQLLHAVLPSNRLPGLLHLGHLAHDVPGHLASGAVCVLQHLDQAPEGASVRCPGERWLAGAVGLLHQAVQRVHCGLQGTETGVRGCAVITLGDQRCSWCVMH
jgi:hypothetical protein